jgi:hypothetical protein
LLAVTITEFSLTLLLPFVIIYFYNFFIEWKKRKPARK